MGWGLEVPMYLSRVTKNELPSAQKDAENIVQFFKNQIIAAVAYSNPIVKDGDEEWNLIEYASIKIPGILEEMIDEAVRLAMINAAINDLDNVTVDE